MLCTGCDDRGIARTRRRPRARGRFAAHGWHSRARTSSGPGQRFPVCTHGTRAACTRSSWPSAERSLWISTYAYYDGPQAFKSLAARMQAVPGLQVTLLLNIQRAARRHRSARAACRAGSRSASGITDWPGASGSPPFSTTLGRSSPHGSGRRPPCEGGDCRRGSRFVTSANLTEAAFDRNIEVGVLARDHASPRVLSRHFGR